MRGNIFHLPKNSEFDSSQNNESLTIIQNSLSMPVSQEELQILMLLREALCSKYKENDKIRLPNCRRQGNSLSIEDCYVELALIRQQDEPSEQPLFEPTTSKHSNFPSELIMNALAMGEKDPEKVLVFGAPGTGKSTLCHHLVYLWAQNEWITRSKSLWHQRYHIVFHLQLKSIEMYWEFVKSSHYKLASWLYENCIEEKWRGENKLTVEKLHAVLYKENISCLLVLDGLDEVSSLLDASDPKSVVLQAALKYPYTLITTRPGYLSLDFVQQYHIDRQVQNLGFGEHKISRYISGHFQKKPQLAEELENHLLQYPALQQMVRIPLVLYLLCEEWEVLQNSGDSNASSLSTLTQLYQHFYKGFQEGFKERGKKENLSLTVVLAYLEQLAFQMLTTNPNQPHHIISRKKIVELLLKKMGTHSLLQTEIEAHLQQLYATGLIHPTSREKHDDQSHEYSHKSLQEFMAAQHIIKILNDPKHEQYAEVTDFLIKHKYTASQQLLFWFVAGLSALKEYEKAHKVFWAALTTHQVDLLGLRHQILIIHVLEQLQFKPNNEKQCLPTLTQDRLPLLNDFSAWLEYSLQAETTSTIVALSSAVAACPLLGNWSVLRLHQQWENYAIVGQQRALNYYILPLVSVSLVAVERLLQQCQMLTGKVTKKDISEQLQWFAEIPWRLIQRSSKRQEIKEQLVVLLNQAQKISVPYSFMPDSFDRPLHLELYCALFRALSWVLDSETFDSDIKFLQEINKQFSRSSQRVSNLYLEFITVNIKIQKSQKAGTIEDKQALSHSLLKKIYECLKVQFLSQSPNASTNASLILLLCLEMPYLTEELKKLLLEQVQAATVELSPHGKLLLLTVLQQFDAVPLLLVQQLTERFVQNRPRSSLVNDAGATAGWQEKLILPLLEDKNVSVKKTSSVKLRTIKAPVMCHNTENV